MAEISSIGSAQGVGAQQGTGSLRTSEGQKQLNSVFTDKKGNGVVDKDDFSDKEIANMAEEKGLIGKSWESVKDSINGLLGNDNKKPMSQKAQENKNEMLAYLKEKNISYKENKDGSIEYTMDGYRQKLSYDGDTAITEFDVGQNKSFTAKSNLVDDSQQILSEDRNKGIRQETSVDKDGNFTTKNYKKDASGKMVETKEFLLTDMGDNFGNVYTGSDIAKMFNQEGFNKDKAEEFFLNTSIGAYNVGLLRDGSSISVSMNDETEILFENGILDKGNVRITTPNGEEYYDKNGNLIK